MARPLSLQNWPCSPQNCSNLFCALQRHLWIFVIRRSSVTLPFYLILGLPLLFLLKTFALITFWWLAQRCKCTKHSILRVFMKQTLSSFWNLTLHFTICFFILQLIHPFVISFHSGIFITFLSKFPSLSLWSSTSVNVSPLYISTGRISAM